MFDRRGFLGSAALAGGVLARAEARAGGAEASAATRAGTQAAATSTPRSDAIGILADYALGLRYEDIPAEVLAVTRAQLLDSVGVAIAGRRELAVQQLIELADDLGGKGEAVLWGTRL
ncbi:MAG: hypothetical protein CFE44_23850, partial [Burkholderiales bacterium PBB4]